MLLPTSMHGRRRVSGWLFLLAMLVLAPAADARAQRISVERTKGSTALRGAFRDVVAEAARATVRVLVDGEQVALGAVVDADGYILTKASQIHDDAEVRLPNGRSYEARLVGLHKELDLAMLKIDASGLPVLSWREDEPALGQWLATPGSGALPLAVGVVSVRARRIAAERGILGISVSDGEDGPTIVEVLPNSGAEKAGLKVGDVVARIAGQLIEDGAALAGFLQNFSPGDTVDVVVQRDEDELEVRATLAAPSSLIVDRSSFQNQLGGKLSVRRGGFPSALQHDTVLQPEDCGGPLVDLSGQAVGLNIARAGRTESYALPAPALLPLLGDMKAGKYAPAGSLVQVSSEESSAAAAARDAMD